MAVLSSRAGFKTQAATLKEQHENEGWSGQKTTQPEVTEKGFSKVSSLRNLA